VRDVERIVYAAKGTIRRSRVLILRVDRLIAFARTIPPGEY
jgi:hypothetical protein